MKYIKRINNKKYKFIVNIPSGCKTSFNEAFKCNCINCVERNFHLDLDNLVQSKPKSIHKKFPVKRLVEMGYVGLYKKIEAEVNTNGEIKKD